MKHYKIIFSILFIFFGFGLFGQTNPDTQPEITAPVGSDKVYTQTRGALKSLRLDTLRNQYMSIVYNPTALSYNPDTSTIVADSLKLGFWLGADGNGYYIDKDKNVLKFFTSGAGGSGDMVKATYDPTNIAGDVFDMDNMVESATSKVFTGTERTKLTGIETGATADQSDAEIETAYNNQVSIVSQVIAEAGTSTTAYRWTPERVKQAIVALGGGGGGTDDQVIDTLSLSGTTLQISLESDGQPVKTVDLASIDTDTQLSDEQVQDKAGAMFTGNTETLITATYQDLDGTIDLVVDNNLANYSNASSGFLTSEVDGSTTNEIQTIDTFSIISNILTLALANDGQVPQTVDLSGYLDDTVLSEATVDGYANNNGYLTSEVDGSTTNEIQNVDTLVMSAGALGISLSSDGVAQKTISLISTDGGNTINAGADGKLYSAAGSGESTTVSDGNTIDLTLVGSDISGEVILDIAGGNILSSSASGLMATEVDGSISNEGSLTVAGGVATTSIINSNTSGSTGVTIEAGTGLSIAEVGNTITLTNTVTDTDTQLTDEQVQDKVGAMVTGNTETLISVTYQDIDGTIDFVVDNDLANYSNATSNFLTSEVDGSTTNEIQSIDTLVLIGTTLGASLSSDGVAQKTVDLSSLQDGTGTDDQTIDVFTLVSNTLSLSLEGDGEATKTLDLSGYLDNTDTQLTQEQVEDYAGALVTIGSNSLINVTYNDAGGNVQYDVESDLSLYDNGTSAFLTSEVDGSTTNEIQTVDTLVLTAGVLGFSLSSDGVAQKTIGLISTDGGNTISAGADGKLYSAAGSGESTTVTDGNTIDLTLTGSDITAEVIKDPSGSNILTSSASGLLATEVDGSTTNEIQTIDTLVLVGTTLGVSLSSDGIAQKTVDLSSLQDGTGTDSQTIDVSTFDGTNVNLSLSGDGEATKTINISSVVSTSNVTAAGALMDSEVDADIQTLSLPASTTISVFGASVIDDADAATARGTLGVDAAGTDNSTNVTFAGTGTYISLLGQQITVDPITESDITDLGTYLTSEVDGSTTNEIQAIDTLVLVGTTLGASLSSDGVAQKTVDLSSLQDGTGTDDQTVDTLSLVGTTLTLALEGDGEAPYTVDLSGLQDGTGTDDQTASEVPITDAGTYFAATDVEGALQELGSDVATNNAKVSNVSTSLSVGTVDANTVSITSDGGADDVTLPAATISTAGMLTTAKWGEIVANTAKVSFNSADNVFRVQDNADATKQLAFEVSGVTTGTTRTLTVPNASGTMYITGSTDVSVADGGTGRSTGTTAYSLIATGTTATGAQQTLANGATTQILVGGGASALPAWTTATGSGSPVRATSPTLVTPVLGVATATSINGATITSGTLNGSVTGTNTGDQTAATVNITDAGGYYTGTTVEAALQESGAKILTAYKTADEAITNDITLNNDADLVIALEANSAYMLDLFLLTNAHVDPDIDYALTVPSGGLLQLIQNSGAAPIGAGTEINIKGTGTDVMYFNYAIVTTAGTAGNLQFQWAQNISSANASSILKGSSMKLTKVD